MVNHNTQTYITVDKSAAHTSKKENRLKTKICACVINKGTPLFLAYSNIKQSTPNLYSQLENLFLFPLTQTFRPNIQS